MWPSDGMKRATENEIFCEKCVFFVERENEIKWKIHFAYPIAAWILMGFLWWKKNGEWKFIECIVRVQISFSDKICWKDINVPSLVEMNQKTAIGQWFRMYGW